VTASGPSRTVPRRLISAARRAAGPVLGSAVAVRTSSPHVVLTFDDGPEPGGTDRILRVLADSGATATFFVLLTRVRRFPGLLDEILAGGHDIGLHGVDHRALPDLPPAAVARNIRAGKAELEDVAGRPVRWHRPPYGRQTLGTWRAVIAAGLVPVLWAPSMWDSRRDVTTPQRLAKVQEGLVRGAVVLGHDGVAGPDDSAWDGPAPEIDRGELTARVLDLCAQRGLTGRSLGDALETGRLVREARFRR
jgi:peptidoglycan/xylan/chitin deacetylase (PgdA/CDA1 family)